MSHTPHTLLSKVDAALKELATTRHFLIGLSGGLDSVVLLKAMAELRTQSGDEIRLRAWHINHQLHEQAASWEQHCAQLCEKLGVEFASSKVTISAQTGIENAAREARYAEFEAALQAGEALLLAHHRDDQIETLLLRLMRGAGSRGLSGIPRRRQIGNNSLLRPLLEIDREELQSYAAAMDLHWIEDPSNDDESFDRNYCRHQLLPLIEARWPGYRASWSKSAALAQESEALLQELAVSDLNEIVTEAPAVLYQEKLLALSAARRRNALRHWLGSFAAEELGWNQLQQLSNEVLQGGAGRFIGSGFELHCFRDKVYLLDAKALNRPLPAGGDASLSELSSTGPLALEGNGSLNLRQQQGTGLALENLQSLSIRYRQGGEACRLTGRPSKSLKKILQEVELPPWLRGRIPLLYSGAQLAYIPGIGASAAFAAHNDEAGCLIEWTPPDLNRRRKGNVQGTQG
ncbi:MAG: tRNA lysidine(34) synthetase TilS [Pseudohongiellaceae bacterium]